MKTGRYGKRGKRLLAAGLILIMSAVSVCGCGNDGGPGSGSGQEGSAGEAADGNGQQAGLNGAAMGRYLEEVTELTEYLEGYRNNIFRLSDDKLIITEPMKELLVSADNGAAWVTEETDWLTPIVQNGGYVQSFDFGADGTAGIVYAYMDLPGNTAGDGEEPGETSEDADVKDDSENSAGTGKSDSTEGGMNTNAADDSKDAADAAGGSKDTADADTTDDGKAGTDTDMADGTQDDSFQEVSSEEWWASPEYLAFVVKPDGTQIPVKLPAAEEEYPSHIWIGDNGRIFVGTDGPVLYEMKEDGNCVNFLTLETSPQKIVFMGNRMIIDGYEFGGLLIYDMDAGEYVSDDVLDAFVKENYGDRTFGGGSWYDMYFFAGEEDVIYLAGEKGVHRHVIGGGAMEQVIDGSLSTFGSPGCHLLGMLALENNEFMAIFTDARLVRYVYDPTVPTVPNETLKAYSLTENDTLRQAIFRYQTDNPEVYVEYEIGMEENSSVTREDALKKLNTEIMAGNGPDFLILDGMPVDSYTEKGLLADISPLIDNLQGEEALFDNIVEAFREDGKICTVPCGIQLPTILCREKYVSDIRNLEDIADAIEKLRADLPEKDLLRVCSEKGIMKTFSIACAPAWKTENGEIDPEAVAEFLTQTKRIYEAQMDGLPEDVINDWERRKEEHIEYYGTSYEDYEYFAYGMDDMNYTMGYRQFLAGTLGYAYSYAELTSVPRTKQFEDCVNLPMDGQSSNVFCANTLAGISAASEHKEHAEGLLKTLLGPEDISLNGFPVNQTAFEKSLYPDDFASANTVYSEMAYLDDDGRTYTWSIYWFDEALADQLRERMTTVDTPYVQDSVLEEAVYKAGVAYMRGEMGVEEAVADVEKNMAIYMAE